MQQCIFSESDIDAISIWVRSNHAIFLDEIQEMLLIECNVDVSVSTLSCTMHQLAFVHKKISKEALQRNDLLRAIWIGEQAEIALEYFVWLDESGVDEDTHWWYMGWAEVGRACVRKEVWAKGVCFSLLPIVSYEGVIGLDIFEGGVTGVQIAAFICEQLVCVTVNGVD